MNDPSNPPDVTDDIPAAKSALRAEMRRLRRSLDDPVDRSRRLWDHVRTLPPVDAARTVMVFDSIPGEPDTAEFVAWCRSAGKAVSFPEDRPAPPPTMFDVVIVPGLAFTGDGERLGQGGGWYDRLLPSLRPDCLTVGVGFEPQLVDELPTEAHDVVLDVVVTEAGPCSRRRP